MWQPELRNGLSQLSNDGNKSLILFPHPRNENSSFFLLTNNTVGAAKNSIKLFEMRNACILPLHFDVPPPIIDQCLRNDENNTKPLKFKCVFKKKPRLFALFISLDLQLCPSVEYVSNYPKFPSLVFFPSYHLGDDLLDISIEGGEHLLKL